MALHNPCQETSIDVVFLALLCSSDSQALLLVETDPPAPAAAHGKRRKGPPTSHVFDYFDISTKTHSLVESTQF